MATVWEAADQRLGRHVAVKVLYAHLAANPAFLERFRREALSAARLHHPNIVQVFDSGKDSGLYFIVMELLGGGSLRDLMTARRLSTKESAAAGVAVSRALAYAHAQGIVHRDIKPANILLSEDGHLKVTDFGIAKASDHDELTSTRDVVGTAAYLSPEQLRGQALGPEADIYALGVVLFELLSGQRPFKTDGGLASATARLTEAAPPLQSVAPDLPAKLCSIVNRCLETDASRRYGDAGRLASDLEAFSENTVTVAPSSVRRPVVTPAGGGGSQAGARGAGRTGSARTAHPTGAKKTVVAPAPLSAAPGGSARGPQPQSRSAPAGGQLTPRPMPPPPPTLAPGPKGRRAVKTIVVLVVLALLSVGGFVLGKRLVDSGSLPVIPGQGTPEAKIIEVRSFDPAGDGAENESRARFVHDRDRGTAWATERYGSAELGGLKSGVGLLFRFDRKASCRSVTVHTTSAGWSGEVRVGDTAASSADAFRLAGKSAGSSTDEKIGTGSASGEYWLLWFTLLPEGGGGYRLEVTEVDFGVCD